MNFFDKPETPFGGVLPLTRERVEAYLRSRDYHFGIDDDGDLYGTWDSRFFSFFLLGKNKEILQVRGQWSKSMPADRYSDVILTINNWNRDRIWPKVYTRENDGVLQVYAETSTDLEYGASDAQIGQLIGCGLGTSLQVFDHLDEQFPEAVAPE